MGQTLLIECAETALRRLMVSVHTQQYLLDVTDRALRRLELLFPLNAGEQQAALYWMGELGDEEDAALLKSIPPANIISSRTLYESTLQKLSGRLGHDKNQVQDPALSTHLVRVASEILLGIKDILRGLLEKSKVGKSLWYDSDLTPLTMLQQEADVALRRLQYLFPASVQDYEATLRWFEEAGTATELGLLFAVSPPANIINSQIEWLHQAAQDQIIERTINDEVPEKQANAFQRLISLGVSLRSRIGNRGNVTVPASSRISGQSVAQLHEALSQPSVSSDSLALVLGEWGGGETATFLAAALRAELDSDAADEEYQVNLVSALANIGGPDAVEGLLRAAESGSERVRLVALSGLEVLATAGAVSMLEYPEPVAIESDEMYDAFASLARKLRALAYAHETPPYVRHKTIELLDTVMMSLNSARLPA